MSFAHPLVFLLVLPVFWLLRRVRRKKSVLVSSIQQWSETYPRRARFLWLPITLRRICLLALLIAMTRPQAPYSTNIQTADGVAIQLLIDVSSSMDMTLQGLEERKSRLEIAKEMVERFIVGDDEKLTGRSNDLIGLITFARYADTRSPLTLGHQALVQIIQNLKIQERPNEDGTAYGDALALAAARLHKMEELNQKRKEEASIQSRVIILLTDGENNSGAHLPIEAAGLAKKWDCRIYTISLGDKAQKYDENLSDSALSASEQILSYISEQTGGVFRKAHDYKSLFSVYREIDRLETSKITTRSLEMTREWFWLPLSIALGCLLCALTLEATWLRITP